ncbi:aconitate hydratase [Geomicrobium sp. JCM 19055]|nr:aconitate hydratase [Geomicrobium sp. JCM 19055]
MGIEPKDFNSYPSRRGNHQVMIRGALSNPRIRNEIVPDIEGGFTKHFPSYDILSMFEAAERYKKEGTPLVIFSGKEYGTGSSRDWAAKGPQLLGVKAIIAESFERIHRSNLIGMGILPLQFSHGFTKESLQLSGDEHVNIVGITKDIHPKEIITVEIIDKNNATIKEIPTVLRLDNPIEIHYYKYGGIMPSILKQIGLKSKEE